MRPFTSNESDLERRLAERTLELCRVQSPYGEESELCDRMLDWAGGLEGAPPARREGNSLVIGAPGDERRPLVALIGHLDTVPPHEDDPPPGLDGDRIVGLGASDMKGGLAVAMSLYEDLAREALGVQPVLVFYDKEEGPHVDSGLRVLLERIDWLADLDFSIVMEPTDNIVQVGCVGSIHATLELTGRPAHSARPWHGENAITAAGGLLDELHRREPLEVSFGEHVFREVFVVTRAEGGRYRNVVPDRFTLNLNYRFAPGKSLEQAQGELESLVAGRAKVTYTDLAPSGAVPRDTPLYRALLEATGLEVAPKQAWTDVARLSELGLDAVNLGPGFTAQAHQSGEHASARELTKAYEALSRFLRAAGR